MLSSPSRTEAQVPPCDNFFTSEQLLVELEKGGIYACGKDRRGFPPALKQVKLKERLYVHTTRYSHMHMYMP